MLDSLQLSRRRHNPIGDQLRTTVGRVSCTGPLWRPVNPSDRDVDRFGREGKENGMKFLLTCAAGALLTLAACNTPEGDTDEDERTEQGDQDDDEE